MEVLVVNSGSSSLKFQLIYMPEGKVMSEGLVERIGIQGGICTVKVNGQKFKTEKNIPNHKDALNMVLESLVSGETKVIENINEVKAIGHRVLHGGEEFKDSVLVTPDVIEKLNELVPLGPLHMPPNMMGIFACQEILPGRPNVAVFDTAFHQTMKAENFMYAIPYSYYEKYKVRRYGFHGTSHKYVSSRVCEFLEKDYSKTRIINCHVGNGASVCAINGGNVVETSMGFTPLEGLIMGTRSGDLDPAIINFIANKEGKTTFEIDTMLNKQSGILGISEKSADMRDIEDGFKSGDERCVLAMNMYVNRIIKYIGSYTALMGGVDVITFTAGVLENSSLIRKLIVDKLGFLNIKLDESVNDFRGQERVISTEDSKVTVAVIPTNEELVIARDCYKLVG